MQPPMEPADNISLLVQRLRSSRRTAQVQAAAALAELAEQPWFGPADCEAAAAAGAIGPLVQMLRSGSMVLQRQAARVLNGLVSRATGPDAGTAGSSAVCATLAEEGGIQALVPLLWSGDASIQAHSADTLAGLGSYNKERCVAIVATGAVPQLVQLCRSDAVSVRSTAAIALANLAHAASCAEPLATAGAAEALAAMVVSGASEGHAGIGVRAAMMALGSLAAHSSDAHSAIAATDAPAALVRQLQSSAPQALAASPGLAVVRERAIERAMCALQKLTCGPHPAACEAVAAAGGIPALAEQLSSSSNPAVLDAAADVVADIAAVGGPEQHTAIAAAGCIPHLVRLLDGEAGSQQVLSAANALCNVTSSCDAAVAAAVAAAGGIPALQAVLGGEDDFAALYAGGAWVNMVVAGGQVPAAAGLAALERLCESPHDGIRTDAAVFKSVLLSHLNSQQQQQQQQPQQPQQQQRQRPPRVCAAPGCGATANLRRCGGCGSVRYCSEACSKAHWRAHKAECRRLQAERAAAATAEE